MILGLDLDLVFVFVLGLVFVWIVDGFGFGFGGLDCVWFWDCFCLDTGYRIPDTYIDHFQSDSFVFGLKRILSFHK